ncbi:MAG: allophanate hydrolase subunit 1 [Proteobacteria bacterium]|nr:allophanate hydrolase subunit 1 [Pseudomonadota bacterium]
MRHEFPRFRAVAGHALLAEFGDRIGDEAHASVVDLDRRLSDHPFEGFVEAVPAYVSLLVEFDPLVADHASAEASIRALIGERMPATLPGAAHEVEVCYEADVAPDLAEVAKRLDMSPEAVVRAHLAGDYRVSMYGFAPGYAYMAGVPEAIRLPRKPGPVHGVPAGSVLIAGPQCLVSTLLMPTGWWIIGRSPTRILTGASERPFLFNIGDRVVFRRIERARLDTALRPG